MEKHIFRVVHHGVMGEPKRVTYHEVELHKQTSQRPHYGEYQARELARQHGIQTYAQGTQKVASAPEGEKVYKRGEFNHRDESNSGIRRGGKNYSAKKESIVQSHKNLIKEALNAKDR